MKITCDFLGGPFHGQRKDIDESELPMAVKGGTYRLSGPVGGPAVGLFLPHRETPRSPGDPITVGEPFPLDETNVGDCSGEKVDGSGIFTAYCALDEGHGGRHVASDGETVVEAWD
ncbi:hypothetical protein AB0N24_04320 [Arthrobacter sp. NPDC093128]|uniref:hypothetical protein n=1 Tax=Arthrobacter sp. NPDC093128 TaxID=3154979 RepID=UPI00342D895D